MDARVSHDEIRRMVRELLRDAVAGGASAAPPDAPPAAPAPAAPPTPASEVGGLSERVRAALGSGGGAIEVAIAGDADLNAFARQVALCALERDLLGAIASNRVRFRLAGGGGREAPAAETSAAAATRGGEAYHWEQGLLGETRITEIARTHRKLVLGRQGLLTPLAWDRARSLGLQVVRTRS